MIAHPSAPDAACTAWGKRLAEIHSRRGNAHPSTSPSYRRSPEGTHGRLEADNNPAENGMCVVALGRRNYLFAGSDSGGERAASIYTLVATAKLSGLNPGTYLRDILVRIAEGHTINRINELVPWRMIPPAATGPA